MTVYGKNQKENLTQDEKNILTAQPWASANFTNSSESSAYGPINWPMVNDTPSISIVDGEAKKFAVLITVVV